MKTFILILHAILFAGIISAQNPNFQDQRKLIAAYWLLGLGLSIQNMYDEGISYVRYKGTGIAPSIGLIKSTEKKYCQFLLQPTFNKLTTDRSNELRPMEVGPQVCFGLSISGKSKRVDKNKIVCRWKCFIAL
jgi:hypothetical protein